MKPTKPAASKAKSKGIHIFEYLRLTDAEPLPSIVVLSGADPFLRGLAIDQLLQRCGGADSVGARRWDGDAIQWPDTLDALRCHSLFDAAAPIVIVDDADSFITANRKQLEDYLKEPAEGRLVLCAKSWPATTRLYQLVDQHGLHIDCGLPQRHFGKTAKVDRRSLVSWLVERAQVVHGVKTDAKTMEYLCDLAGNSPGMIDQELAKLSNYVGSDKRVTTQHVNEIGCGWRLRTTSYSSSTVPVF